MRLLFQDLDDVVERARAHCIDAQRVESSPWPAVLLRPCPNCGDGCAVAEWDGFDALLICKACAAPERIADALLADRELLPDADKVDVLLDIVIALVRDLGREVAT